MKVDKVIIAGLAIAAILAIIVVIGGACVVCVFLASVPGAHIGTGAVEHRQDTTSHAAVARVDLNVSTVGGNVEVQLWDGDTIEVTYDVYASSGNLDAVQTSTNYTMDGDTLKIAAEAKLAHPQDLFLGSRGAHVYVKVPKNTSVSMTLTTLGGNIKVPPLSGSTMVLNTMGGNINVNGDRYDSVKATTAGGNIQASYEANTAVFSTLGGNINIDTTQTTGSLKATTMGGNIDVTLPYNTKFSVDASTLGGEVRHSTIALTTTQNSKTHVLGYAEAGRGTLDLSLSTTGGNIDLSY